MKSTRRLGTDRGKSSLPGHSVFSCVMLLATACSVKPDSGSDSVALPSFVHCIRNRTTGSCACTNTPERVHDDEDIVPDCSAPPVGSLVCAEYYSNNEVTQCSYLVPHCSPVNREFTSCDCSIGALNSDFTEVTTCTGRICCLYDDKCHCTDLPDSSLSNTEFDPRNRCLRAVRGQQVASCTINDLRLRCTSPFRELNSCDGLQWRQ